MANKKPTYNQTDFIVAINRSNGQPLDSSEVWYNMSDLEDYAKGSQAYVGQQVTYVDTTNNKIYYYRIADESGALQEYTPALILVSMDGGVTHTPLTYLAFEKSADGSELNIITELGDE